MTASATSLLPGATRRLAAFSAGLSFNDIPAQVIASMKACMLDSIGCCLHGARLPWTRHVRAMVEQEDARPVAPLFGTNRKTSPAGAALVNATAGHAFELDDIHKESILHPGSIAVPVVFALAAQRGGASGRELLTAMAAGYEVGTRVGNAATMASFFRGFHPQGTSGVFVAATAASHMLRLDARQTLNALGIAGSQASGLMAAQEEGMVKRFHSGRAAQSGVYAALLARHGLTGIPDVLEAVYGGYLSTYSSEPAPSRLLEGLGSDWEAAKVGYKPHACVTSIHALLDGLAGLMKDHGISHDQIERVEAAVGSMTHKHCAWTYKAQGVTAAQMNLFYGVAVMALDGMAFTSQYTEERMRDPRIAQFIERVSASIDPQIDEMGPAFRHAARVTLHARNGKRYQREILHRRGSPENPLSQQDIEFKFRNVVAGCLPAQDIERVVSLTGRLELLESTSDLAALLAKEHP